MNALSPRWSFVLCYYNEAEYLPATLASLIAQTLRPFRLILVDNASTDGSAQVARDALANAQGIDVVWLHDTRPGKVHALETALGALDTPLVALGDADTIYPPDYLAQAQAVYDAHGPETVGAMAMGIFSQPDSVAAKLRRTLYPYILTRVMARQCHTGGYGQTFRTDALIRAGGFSAAIWPYLLMDHEVVQRVLKQGRIRYARDLWCLPSLRRADRTKVRWTLPERLLYHVVPFGWKDWYFRDFLGPRLHARRANNLALREKSWLKP